MGYTVKDLYDGFIGYTVKDLYDGIVGIQLKTFMKVYSLRPLSYSWKDKKLEHVLKQDLQL